MEILLIIFGAFAVGVAVGFLRGYSSGYERGVQANKHTTWTFLTRSIK